MLWRKREEQAGAKGAGTSPAGGPATGHGGGSGFDTAASDRSLAACANILAWCGTAISETSAAAAPFLTVQERASLRAQATNFESLGYHTGAIIQQSVAPAPVIQEAPVPVPGEMLTRDEVETIVLHRVEIAVQDTLAKLGVAPGLSIRHEVERQVEVQLATQEHRLLEYVKLHLTDSLKVLEATLSERLGEVLEGKSELAEARAEVDAQVEGAREALLRQIEEVRTVNVGFNIDSYAAELAGVASVEIEEDDEVILEAEEIEIAAQDFEEDIEIGGEAEESAAEQAAAEQAAAKQADDEKAAAKKQAAAEKVEAKRRAADEKAAAKKQAAAEKVEAKRRAADEKAAAKKQRAADEKQRAADEKAAAAQAEAEQAAVHRSVVAEVVLEEDDLEISLMPSPGQDMAEVYLQGQSEESPDGDTRDGDHITLDLDEEEGEGAAVSGTTAEEEEAALAHYVAEGDRAVAKNRFAGAVTSYDSALRVAPDRAELYMKRGLAYKRDGNDKKAFLDLMKARDLDSSLPEIRKHLTAIRKSLSAAEAGSKGAKKS
jgi:hypothetical protein